MTGASRTKGNTGERVAAALSGEWFPDAGADYAAAVAELLAAPEPDWSALLGPGGCADVDAMLAAQHRKGRPASAAEAGRLNPPAGAESVRRRRGKP